MEEQILFNFSLSILYIENNLEEDEEEILKLFKYIEELKIEKEQKNLIKLKKLYF